MYKPEMVSNILLWLICHKTKPNQTKPNQIKLNLISFLDTYNLNMSPVRCISLSFGPFVWIPPLSILRRVQRILQEDFPGVYSFAEIFDAEFVFKKFSLRLTNPLDGTQASLSADNCKFLLIGHHWCVHA